MPVLWCLTLGRQTRWNYGKSWKSWVRFVKFVLSEFWFYVNFPDKALHCVNLWFSVVVTLQCISQFLLGRLPKVDLIILEGEKCPYVRTSVRTSIRPYVRPSTKSFFDLSEIWYIGRGRWVMHDSRALGQLVGLSTGAWKGACVTAYSI